MEIHAADLQIGVEQADGGVLLTVVDAARLSLLCVDYTGCVYRIDVQDAHSSYSRQFDHEDMRELTERLDAALNGSPRPPARNWRDDKYPDETLADREAPVFDIQPTGRHSDQWTLTISEIYDYRATIGQDQLENLAKEAKRLDQGLLFGRWEHPDDEDTQDGEEPEHTL